MNGVRSVDNLVNLYFTSVGRNSKLLLNVPPTRDGLLHDIDVERLSGISPSRIVLAYSHTHSGGLIDLARRNLPGGELIEAYLDDLASRLATVVRQSRDALGPMWLEYACGRCDLAAQRDDLDHDDEWGEFNQAGSYNWSIVPQLPATGNHEYVDVVKPDGSESRTLGPYFPLQFALPANGVPGLKTTYYVDYQGVRFIVLDGTSAIDLGTMAQQTQWLDATLASSKAKWNVVLFHQPVFTCARPQDTSEVKAAWKPVFDQTDDLGGLLHTRSPLLARAFGKRDRT